MSSIRCLGRQIKLWLEESLHKSCGQKVDSVLLGAVVCVSFRGALGASGTWSSGPFIRYSWIIPQIGDASVAVAGIALAGAIALLGSLGVKVRKKHKNQVDCTDIDVDEQ